MRFFDTMVGGFMLFFETNSSWKELRRKLTVLHFCSREVPDLPREMCRNFGLVWF